MSIYGFYTEKGAKVMGTAYYLDNGDKEVEVVFTTRDPTASQYEWPDKQCVGIVRTFVRAGKPGIADLVEEGRLMELITDLFP